MLALLHVCVTSTQQYSHAIWMSLSAPSGLEGSVWGWAAKQNSSNVMHGCISCEMVLQYVI